MRYYIKIENEYLYNLQQYLNPQNNKLAWTECWTSHPTIYRQIYCTSLKNIRKTKLCIQYYLKCNKIPRIYIKNEILY